LDSYAGLVETGWSPIQDDGFIGLVGPFFQKTAPDTLLFCFPTGDKHRNRRGMVQGGALMTFADRCLGIVARTVAACEFSATVQMDMHFTHVAKIGDMIELHPHVVRESKRLIFLRADLVAGATVVASVNGIWKKLGLTAGAFRN